MNLRNILSTIGGAFTQDDEERRRLPPMEELRRQQALRALQRRDRNEQRKRGWKQSDDIGTRQSDKLFSDEQRARRDLKALQDASAQSLDRSTQERETVKQEGQDLLQSALEKEAQRNEAKEVQKHFSNLADIRSQGRNRETAERRELAGDVTDKIKDAAQAAREGRVRQMELFNKRSRKPIVPDLPVNIPRPEMKLAEPMAGGVQKTDEELVKEVQDRARQNEAQEVVQETEEEPTFRATTADNPLLMEETVVTAEREAEDPDPNKGDGFLSRLGRNPELLAQIAQLGGGLISGMAQDKAQRRADAATQDRMARANLIGALTGRTPGVTAERADTGGFFSLDTLGKAIKGGGEIAQDEIGRREEQEQLEYDRGIAEEETEYQREQDRLDRKESEEKIEQGWASIRQGGIRGATALKTKAAIMKGSIDVVDSFLDNLENYQKLEEGDSISWRRMFDGLATNFGLAGTYFNPEAQQYTDSRALIVAEVARIINGGGANVSAKEQQMAESVVPNIQIPRDTQAYGIKKLERLREILSLRRNAIAEGINPTSSLYDQIVFDEAEGQETETEPTEADIAAQGQDLTRTERELLRSAMANPDDAEIKSAIDKNPKLKKIIGQG